MFGTFRFTMAFLVVISHLVATRFVGHFGYYAVRAFFVLSGFSITASLNEVYGFSFRRFWINRLLRLMPPYLLACAATAVAILLFSKDAQAFMPRWGFAMTLTGVTQNLLVVPLAFQSPDFRFIEPAWSIAVELVLYLFLFVGMARNERGARLCLVAGATYHLALIIAGAPFAVRYFSIFSAILSFSLGAMIYFHGGSLSLLFKRRGCAIAACLGWAANLLAAGTIMPDSYAELGGYYASIALSVAVIASLSALKPGSIGRRIDTTLGNLSYPVFLLQWLGGFIGHMLLGSHVWRGWKLAFAATPIILILAAVVARLYAYLIEPIRCLVRDGQTLPTLGECAHPVGPNPQRKASTIPSLILRILLPYHRLNYVLQLSAQSLERSSYRSPRQLRLSVVAMLAGILMKRMSIPQQLMSLCTLTIWRWAEGEHFKFREHEGRGYWNGDSWEDF